MSNVVWITGASGGIGREVLTRLSDKGWIIIASGRDESKLDTIADNLENVHVMPADVTDENLSLIHI